MVVHISILINRRVDEAVLTSDVRAGIRSKQDVSTLELGCLCITTHGDHGVPQLLRLLWHEVGQTSVDVARGDGVHASEVTPLIGKGASHVDAAGLCDVVGGLRKQVSTTRGIDVEGEHTCSCGKLAM